MSDGEGPWAEGGENAVGELAVLYGPKGGVWDDG